MDSWCKDCGMGTSHLRTCSHWLSQKLRQPSTPNRHPSSQRLHDILKKLGELHDKKQRDYGTDADPFANLRATEDWACPACHTPIPGWLGALIRLSDKVKRLQAFTRNGKLANEGVIDSLDDIGVYAPIARVMYEEEEEDEVSVTWTDLDFKEAGGSGSDFDLP